MPTNMKGYWADSRKNGQFLTEFYQCETIAGESCLAEFECLEGFGGRHCSVPADGYMLISASPIECADSSFLQTVGCELGATSVLFERVLILAPFSSHFTVSAVHGFDYHYDGTSVDVRRVRHI